MPMQALAATRGKAELLSGNDERLLIDRAGMRTPGLTVDRVTTEPQTCAPYPAQKFSRGHRTSI
jgi:hypothetical protein